MSGQVEKIVYFVRHGQSIDNTHPMFQSVDSPLSERGKQQAERIADRLSKIEFELLVASPLARAKETATIISQKTEKEVFYSPLFVERIAPSEIGGKPWSDAVAQQVWRDWEQTQYGQGKRVSNGENYDDTIARVDTALAFLIERPETRIAVVTHGSFLRSLVARVLIGESLTASILQRFQELSSIENTAITVLKYREAFEEDFRWRLWTLNDHSHFAD